MEFAKPYTPNVQIKHELSVTVYIPGEPKKSFPTFSYKLFNNLLKKIYTLLRV
jgi:hypothetical protein